MSRYMMIHRLRFPAVLLLIGVIALLYKTGLIDHPVSWCISLILILVGILMLAERAVLASDGGYPPFPGSPSAGASDFRATAHIPTYPGQPEAYIPPAHQAESDKNSEGGQQ
ncbi:MAG: hypothetical protein ABR906_00160 [Terracidiphilus sp.]|jgi:hypothetical protein